ncbi:MAG: hypothetical protein U5R48_08130 [Gammaproteobacteria bacterium]|nr:hypothetical protein [Gammaproteobacteria bacterium]
MRTLPLDIGVHFEETFVNYSLAEEIPERGEWNIDIGRAQVSLFRTLLPAMFRRVEELEDPGAAGTDLDAVLVPRVDEMQFAIPFQTKSNFFEVWIRYDLTLLHPGSDRVIASWPLTGYGRTRDAMLDSCGRGDPTGHRHGPARRRGLPRHRFQPHSRNCNPGWNRCCRRRILRTRTTQPPDRRPCHGACP